MEFSSAVLGSSLLAPGIRRFRLASPKGFAFEAGQYFILDLGGGYMKPFSFCNAPTEGDYIEFTTRMSGSEYKNRLGSLRPGDGVRVRGPSGDFTYKGQGKIVFLAGGIGITPIRSLCKSLTDAGADCEATLIWGVNTLDEAFFRDDLDAMTEANSRLTVVYVPFKPPDGWVGHSGFISAEHVKAEAPYWQESAFYVCGPPKMVEAMRTVLSSIGVGDMVVEKIQ
jgi:glycine betaine catabolism B